MAKKKKVVKKTPVAVKIPKALWRRIDELEDDVKRIFGRLADLEMGPPTGEEETEESQEQH